MNSKRFEKDQTPFLFIPASEMPLKLFLLSVASVSELGQQTSVLASLCWLGVKQQHCQPS